MVTTPRVTNDTNVWISALYFKGKPASIVDLIDNKKIVSITSQYILDEIKSTMVKKRFNASPIGANATITYIKSISELVEIKNKNYQIRDLKDNPVLETAINGRCDYLITGDSDLLVKKNYKQIKIVKPEEFLKIK